jgi:hypothetical protein
MVNSSRRRILMLAGLSAVAGSALVGGALPAAAQMGKPVVGLRYQNIKRGTIHSVDPATRGFVIVWQDMGRVKLKAADVVANYMPGSTTGGNFPQPGLQPGQIVDVQWYDYIDFLVARTTPEISAKAKAMVASGARAEGLPDSEQQIRLMEMSGMVVKTDLTLYTIDIVNPTSGEVLQTPQIRTEEGLAALRTLKPGDPVTTVFSIQTAIKVTIVR